MVKSGKNFLPWGDPIGLVRPVEIPVFASLGEVKGAAPAKRAHRAKHFFPVLVTAQLWH